MGLIDRQENISMVKMKCYGTLLKLGGLQPHSPTFSATYGHGPTLSAAYVYKCPDNNSFKADYNFTYNSLNAVKTDV